MNKKLSTIFMLLPFLLFAGYVFAVDFLRPGTGDLQSFSFIVPSTAATLQVDPSYHVAFATTTAYTWTGTQTFASTTIAGNFNIGILTATTSAYLGSLTLGTKLPNAQLANSSFVVTTASPLGGAATINLGDTLALTCTGCLTSLAGAASSTLLGDINKFSNINFFSTTTVAGNFNTGTLTATSGTSYLNTLSVGNGITVVGSVTLPALSVANAALQGSGGLTITPVGSLTASGCATVVLGGTCTLTTKYDFTPTTNFNTIMSATSTSIWATNSAGFYASSTSYLASTTITSLNLGIMTATGTIVANSIGVGATTTPAKTLGVSGDIYAASTGTTTLYLETSGKGTCLEMKNAAGNIVRAYISTASAWVIAAGTCK